MGWARKINVRGDEGDGFLEVAQSQAVIGVDDKVDAIGSAFGVRNPNQKTGFGVGVAPGAIRVGGQVCGAF